MHVYIYSAPQHAYSITSNLKDNAQSSSHLIISNRMFRIVPGKLYDLNSEFTLQGISFLFSLVLLAWIYA